MHRACVGMNDCLTSLSRTVSQRVCRDVASEMMVQAVYKLTAQLTVP